MALRVFEPNRKRVFRTPLVWLVGPLAVFGCIYLFTSLGWFTIKFFFVCSAVGIVLYFLWGFHKSRLKDAPAR
jgi:APA family basic amino acid/polyamine antiporter